MQIPLILKTPRAAMTAVFVAFGAAVGAIAFGAWAAVPCGVLAAVAGHPACESLLAARAKVVALRPDLEHRGVARKLHPAIAAIDYRDFVALCCACDKVQSWV